jgi:hypothetical protein
MHDRTVVTSTGSPHPALSLCGGRGFLSRYMLSLLEADFGVNPPFSRLDGRRAGDEG